MNFRLARSLSLLILSVEIASAQVETARSVESSLGGNSAAAGASLNAAPAPIAFTVSPLSAAPLGAAPLSIAPAAFAAAPAAVAAAVPILAPALAAPAELPAAAAAAPALEVSPRAAPSDGFDEGGAAAQGRALFDAAAPAKKNDDGIWAKIKDWARIGDRVPSWPGTPGERVRLGGQTYTLGRRLADGGGSSVWQTAQGDFVVKILHPQFAELPHYGGEAGLLRAIKESDIPHARLIAASADGRVMVKEFIKGAGADELLRNGFEARHTEGWAELGAKLIRAGVTADLAPGNLIWQHWRTRWVLVDAGGLEDGGPEKVVAQLLSPAARRAGVDAGVLLAALRGRLGPDSAAWAKTLASLPASARDALAAHDRALPSPPVVAFGPAADRAPYPDKAGPARDAAKALGYDPLTVKPRRMLHADDPGKLNTQVFSVEPEGKAPVVVKVAEWGMIRRELAVRRVIRRWFGRYFDAPAAFGVDADHDSYLVMELKRGSGAYASNPLTPEQRAALAVLVHAFGLGDMNGGNVLYPAHARPVLIDFEQALTRHTPVAGRIPDEGIALEMPWVSRFELNRAEDYQPAARAWRALLAEPESSAALLADFSAAGYTAAEAAALLTIVKQNTADLDWSIQNDVDFVNQFAARRREAAARQ